MRNDVGKFVCVVSLSASGFRVSYRSGILPCSCIHASMVNSHGRLQSLITATK